MFTEMFRAWVKDLPAYLGWYLLAGSISVGISSVLYWIFFGTPWPTTDFVTSLIGASNANAVIAYAAVGFAGGMLGAFVTAWFTAVVTYYAIWRRRGRRVPWSEATRMGSRRFPSILGGALLLSGLFVGLNGLDTVLIAGQFQGPISGTVLAAECGLLLLLPLILFLWLSLLLYAPAVMMEGVGALDSFRRSWSMTRGRRLSLFGALLLTGLVLLTVELAAIVPTTLAGNPLASLVGQVAATAVVGSWEVLLAAVAYELIGQEERDLQQRLAFLRPAFPPG
jgi:hypothetical protein